MTCSRSCSRNSGAVALALLFAACAGARPRPPAVHEKVAVLPLINLSGGAAPLRELQGLLERALTARGVPLAAPAEVEAFLARRRLRYTGGIDREAAQALATELGASAVLITAVTLYQEAVPPRVGLSARLVSAAAEPAILWIDEGVRTGDESPGLFELGLVDDVRQLEAEVTARLAGGLSDFLAGTGPRAPACASGRFAPQASYRSASLGSGASVAVLPFVNETVRRNAGDVVALQFVRQLQALGMRAVEPGVVRDQLLTFRISADEGISLDVARVVTELLHADFVLAGTVRDYADAPGAEGSPVVQFTALLLDRANNEVVWQATSFHRGDEGVFFFDVGHVDTVSALCCRMAASALDPLVPGAKKTSAAQNLRAAPPP